MPKTITGTTTSTFTDANSVQNVFGAQGGWVVNNSQVFAQQQYSDDEAQGTEIWGDVFVLPAGAHSLLPGTLGFRVMSFNASIPVLFTITLFYPYEPSMILGSFGGVLNVPPGTHPTQTVFNGNTSFGTLVQSYTPPTGATAIRVRLVAGGGGAGGSNTAAVGQIAAGGGGGGGGYSEVLIPISSLAPGPIQVTIGSGGAAGSNLGGNGGAGAVSSFIDNAGIGTTWASANGGGGGGGGASLAVPTTDGSGGDGGIGTIGSILEKGGPGLIGGGYTAAAAFSGAGGSGAGIGNGGGIQRFSTTGGLSGTPSSGGGGSGGLSLSGGTGQSGGLGGSGIVIIDEFYS